MTKNEFIEFFKSEGIDVAEDMAVAAARSIFNLLRVLLPKMSKDFGVISGPMIDLIEPQVLKMLDKIDGEDDPEY